MGLSKCVICSKWFDDYYGTDYCLECIDTKKLTPKQEEEDKAAYRDFDNKEINGRK